MATPFLGSDSEHSSSRLRARRFTRLTRDVYAETDQSPDATLRASAVQLVFPEAVICGRTAAVLQGLPVDDDGLVHYSRGMWHPRSERPQWRTHRLDIADDELIKISGLRVTDGPRTWVDLAAGLDEEGLVAVGDVVLRRYGGAAVAEAVQRAWGRPGVVALRAAAPMLDPGADSAAESRTRLRLHRAGFTALQHKVVVLDEAGGWVAAPDLADSRARVAVQHDGWVHFADGSRRQHDVDRDELTRRLDWEVVISTAKDDRRPQLLVSKVAAAYHRAACRWGRQVLPPHLRRAA